MKGLDDPQTVSSIASGVGPDFDQFLVHCNRRALDVIRRTFPYLINNGQDIAQSVLLKIHRNAWRFQNWNRPQIEAYLKQMIKNEAINYSKSKIRQGEISIDDILSALSNPATSGQPLGRKVSSDLARLTISDPTESRLEAIHFKRIFKRLKNDDREIIELVYGDGLKIKEYAKIKGISEEAAYKRHDRALERLISLYRLC
jgi:RNA polymerase sigma factor (sigma-70 family)